MWTVTYQYQKGADALRIDAAELLADGNVVARDVHEGTAGSEHHNHQYTLAVPEMKAGAKWVLRTKAHVTPWSGGGTGDSAGTVSMSQPAAVRLYAPEQPLPAIRATTPVTQDRDRATYDWAKRHQQVLESIKTNPPQIVMIGDSITHYWAGLPTAPHAWGPVGWKQAFGDRAVANLGCGSDRTENVLWRIDHGELDGIAPKQVVVLVGTNNLELDTPAQVLTGIDAVCRRIHAKLPDTHILLLGILPRKDQAKLKADLDKVNYLLQTRLHPRPYIDVLDPGNKFRDADGTLNESLFADGLHPNAAGYGILAAALSAHLETRGNTPGS
jgi:lysophospholipase L1-like esterase